MPKRKRGAPKTEETADTAEERYFLDPKSVSVHLYCSICQEVFIEPQRAPCGHSFCKKCILPWLKQNPTCPEDRKTVRPNDLHHDFILENIIGDQQVACPFRRQGCVYISQLGLLTTHKKSCKFNPANLPDFMKEDAVKMASPAASQSVNAATDVDADEEEDGVLPAPVIPSLKMRLFSAGGDQKQLLCSMFDSGKSSQSSPNTGP